MTAVLKIFGHLFLQESPYPTNHAKASDFKQQLLLTTSEQKTLNEIFIQHEGNMCIQ